MRLNLPEGQLSSNSSSVFRIRTPRFLAPSLSIWYGKFRVALVSEPGVRLLKETSS